MFFVDSRLHGLAFNGLQPTSDGFQPEAMASNLIAEHVLRWPSCTCFIMALLCPMKQSHHAEGKGRPPLPPEAERGLFESSLGLSHPRERGEEAEHGKPSRRIKKDQRPTGARRPSAVCLPFLGGRARCLRRDPKESNRRTTKRFRQVFPRVF